ncbi:hypothetical protein THAOC_00783 [Thalassiosira oceanica]|uniref:Uncharacterized protein n=1 Tax=Thalassiosira oceanica TaxID=159749 RepID=K0TJN7_THAOC|nr:hypothetical protein THAOC_00783 [Thalassiosira oceanica]|eukprot:EJK77389.1 hypothetical protein THAOC_00783 [Thalassiosira oceanica]
MRERIHADARANTHGAGADPRGCRSESTRLQERIHAGAGANPRSTNHQQNPLQSAIRMAPYRSRTDEKMVPSCCLAALSLPPGQLAPQVSPRPAITQRQSPMSPIFILTSLRFAPASASRVQLNTTTTYLILSMERGGHGALVHDLGRSSRRQKDPGNMSGTTPWGDTQGDSY